MRRLSQSALVAVPLLLFAGSSQLLAAPPGAANFGCGGHCIKMFPHIHQHGPLFNYGPYYGYYPFAPYGPWDAYLRYDPLFYGDQSGATGDYYGLNPRLRGLASGMHGLGHSGLFHHGCSSCSFLHASWLQGGWFRGHNWLDGGHGCGHKLGHARGCTSCGGVAVAPQPAPSHDPAAKYSGIGLPTQSAVFYTATPTLDPALELVPTAGQTK